MAAGVGACGQQQRGDMVGMKATAATNDVWAWRGGGSRGKKGRANQGKAAAKGRRMRRRG